MGFETLIQTIVGEFGLAGAIGGATVIGAWLALRKGGKAIDTTPHWASSIIDRLDTLTKAVERGHDQAKDDNKEMHGRISRLSERMINVQAVIGALAGRHHSPNE